MNFKTTLTLLFLLAAAAVAAWVLKPGPDADPWAKPVAVLQNTQHPTLLATLGVDRHRLTGITFAPAGRPALTLAREGDGWRMLAPIDMPVKTPEVEGFLLAPLEETRVAEQAGAPQAAGGGRITLNLGRRTLHLDLGPDSGAGLAQLSVDGKPYQVDNPLHRLLAHLPPLVAFINPTLDTPPASRITGLTLKSARGDLGLLRQASGRWVIHRPGFPRASGEAIADYCAVLAAAKITELPQETADPALFGLDRPVFEISLDEAGRTTRVEIGARANLLTRTDRQHGKQDQVFIRLTRPDGVPLIAAVESPTIAPLVQGEAFFRDTHILRMKPAEARRLEADAFDLTQDAQGRIRFTDPKAPFAVDAALGQAAFKAPFQLKPTGLGPKMDRAAHSFKVTDVFGRQETLLLAPSGEDFAIAHPGETDSFIVPQAQVAPLLMAAVDLRDRQIRWLPADREITQMTLEQTFCGLKFDFVKRDGVWMEANGRAFEMTAAEALEKALERPQVEKYASPGANRDFVVVARLRAKAGADPDAPTLDLGVNADDLGRLTGSFGSHEPTLAALPALSRLLQGEFRDRQLLSLAPTQIAGIELGARVKITRRPDGVFATAGATLTQAQCAALFDTLGNLRSEEPAGVFAPGAGDTVIRIDTTDGKRHTVRIRGAIAAFGGRHFRWDPRSPQTRAVQAALDSMK